ncbi:MAG: hypothetical protein WD512_04105 [Candidatus Paceibacterota bacterium]
MWLFNQSQFNFTTMTRSECYFMISRTNNLYDWLDDEFKEEFIKSLKKSSVRHLVEYPPKSELELYSYNNYKEHFIHQPTAESKKLFFIRKELVPRMHENAVFYFEKQLKTKSVNLNFN